MLVLITQYGAVSNQPIKTILITLGNSRNVVEQRHSKEGSLIWKIHVNSMVPIMSKNFQ